MQINFPDGEYSNRLPELLESACQAALITSGGRYTLTPHAMARYEERRAELPDRLPVNQAVYINATIKDGALDEFLFAIPVLDGDYLYVAYTINAYVRTLFFGAPPTQRHKGLIKGECLVLPQKIRIPRAYDPSNPLYTNLTNRLRLARPATVR